MTDTPRTVADAMLAPGDDQAFLESVLAMTTDDLRRRLAMGERAEQAEWLPVGSYVGLARAWNAGSNARLEQIRGDQ